MHHVSLILYHESVLSVCRDSYAREIVKNFLNANSVREIIFVRGATEAINLVASTVADTKIEGLKKFYNVDSKEGLEYFTVHMEADVEHREQSASLMRQLSKEEQLLAEEAGMSTVKHLWNFLSGLCVKHNISMN